METRVPPPTTGLASAARAASSLSLSDTEAEINSKVSVTLANFKMISASNQALSEKAAGVLVFPRVTKSGAGVGGKFGEGSLQIKGKTVSYHSIGSTSLGPALGPAPHSEIIMFMTQASLRNFTSSTGWSISANAGITVVSSVSDDGYDAQTLQKPILAFAFSGQRLSGDLAVAGTRISRIYPQD